MNIYEKLNAARIKFQSGNPTMSGENTFAKYKYFELSDILPIINKIGDELKFVCLVSFTPDLATLTVIDVEKPDDKITFASPMSTAALKGCHEVQNLGAVETYIKRYLYQNAFEIVENDALNGTQGMTEPKGKSEKDSPEFVKLKGTVIDWLQVSPPVFNADWEKYANDAITAKNTDALQKCIDTAVAVMAKRTAK